MKPTTLIINFLFRMSIDHPNPSVELPSLMHLVFLFNFQKSQATGLGRNTGGQIL